MRDTLKQVLATAWPVMLSYVPVGTACGVLAAQAGMEPWMSFVMGATFLSGSGQFMMSSLYMAGLPVPSIAASVSAISLRFALYSASFAPHLARASRGMQAAVTGTFTEEAYGISLAKLVEGRDWSATHALILNFALLLTWALSCLVGTLLGGAVDIPTALASFACTSLFICLLVSQDARRGNIVAAAVAALALIVCKSLGLASVAVPAAAALGVIAAVASDVFIPKVGEGTK